MIKPWKPQGPFRVLAEKYGKALVAQDYMNHQERLVEWIFFHGSSPGCAIFMPVTRDNRVIAVEQFRGGIGKINLELPGGNFEPGEDALNATARELEEETGYYSPNLILLREKPISLDPASNFNKGLHYVLALGCEKITNWERKRDPNEDIEIRLVPLDEWIESTLNGLIDDAKSIVLTHLALKYLGAQHLKMLLR